MTLFIIFSCLALSFSLNTTLITEQAQARLSKNDRLLIAMFSSVSVLFTMFILYAEGQTNLGNVALMLLFCLSGILSIIVSIIYTKKKSKLTYFFWILTAILWISAIIVDGFMIFNSHLLQRALMMTTFTHQNPVSVMLVMCFYGLVCIPVLEFVICFVNSLIDTFNWSVNNTTGKLSDKKK